MTGLRWLMIVSWLCGSLVGRADVHAVVDVTVITMSTPAVMTDATVLVRDDVIVAVGENVAVPRDATVIDGTSRFLMPGLADMHVHVALEDHFWLYLANGVTTIRNMWGTPAHHTWQAEIEAGERIAPTIYTVGPLMDGPGSYWPAATIIERVEDVDEAVAAVAEGGFPALKVYNELSVDVYQALVRAAHSARLRVEGHVPNAVGLERVIRAGQLTNEHLSGYERATLAPGAMPRYDAMDWRSRLRERARLARAINDGSLDLDAVHDPAKIEGIARRSAAAGFWNIPTLVLHTGRDDPRTRPSMRYLDPFTTSGWKDDPTIAGDRKATEAVWHRYRLNVVAALEQARAPWLVGTDAPNPFVVPGFAIHQELDHLREAGISRQRILRAATLDAAVFLGVDDVGRIGVGQRADFILLDDNPLTGFETLSRPLGVMVRGRWLSRARLDQALQEIEGRYAAFRP